MRKNTIIIIICIILVTVLVTWLNYDKILNYFTNKGWEIADCIGEIEESTHIDLCGTRSNFLVVESTAIIGYDENAKKSFEKSINLKTAINDTAGEYAIIAEKDANTIYVLYENEIAWTDQIKNGNILGVDINKNGYAAIIYSQSGYKSLVKVFSNLGAELFTSYFASSYALDVAISNDNKTLAIAEIFADGINAQSKIKLIDIKDATQNNMISHDLADGEIITDIEYTDENSLMILTDKSAKVFEKEIEEVVSFEKQNSKSATIKNNKNIVTINATKDGLFTEEINVAIYDLDARKQPKTYKLEEMPSKMIVKNNIIALDFGSEILFVNTSGNFVKRCRYTGQLRDMQLYGDGKIAVLVFRDSMKFVKLGGI